MGVCPILECFLAINHKMQFLQPAQEDRPRRPSFVSRRSQAENFLACEMRFTLNEIRSLCWRTFSAFC